ncbi:MAG TPA: enoyl-CoA hydratase [Mycobacteriales bacterium]|nr:enoyl-CoA hydratase [Mycobacteriales bacterium]
MAADPGQNEEPELLRELRDGVLRLTINRAAAGNALTTTLRDQLPVEFEQASADLAVRAVVLTGAGQKQFCTGADLRSRPAAPTRPEGAPDRSPGDVSRMIRGGWQRLIGSILDCEKPVIAAVNGTAAGGGMHLALACDLVIASDNAKFVEVFIRRGIAPDAGGAYLLSRLIGPQRAKELMFFGDDVPAARALELGLVNRVVPADELQAVTAELAGRLASGPTKALWVTKWLVNRAMDGDRQTSLVEEAWGQELVNASLDAREGVAAFVERRSPEFRGW